MRALLYSGGIESTCLAYWKRPKLCLTIDYGQVCAQTEIEAAKAISSRLKLEHIVLKVLPGSSFGLLGNTSPVDSEKPEFWPFRNQFLVTTAAMALYGGKTKEIWVGSVKSDRRFKDGSKAFFNRLDSLMSYQEGGIHIRAPAITLTTHELIKKSRTPKSILGATFSCHRASMPCGDCPGCWKQQRLLYLK